MCVCRQDLFQFFSLGMMDESEEKKEEMAVSLVESCKDRATPVCACACSSSVAEHHLHIGEEKAIDRLALLSCQYVDIRNDLLSNHCHHV
jgi:hypothetical protein